ncbi:PREDICTED: antigen KI-67, partial [Acanthisitta chloris]|uniref:antigen KI-67 n=1 Tax=Acanthisitta chloris TaxID=57068 RepID=UPI0004F0E9AB
MPRYGKIVVIKRNGTDGIIFPLTSTLCLFGRKSECDIRMRLPWVSGEHCKIEINENKELYNSEVTLCLYDFVDNAECEGKNANENQQTTEKNIPEALPIKLQTPRRRKQQISKKSKEMSPFCKLYENLKHELNEKAPVYKGNAAVPKDDESVLVSRDTGQRHLQDPKELSTPGRAKGAEVTTRLSRYSAGNHSFFLEQCSIERSEYPIEGKTQRSATATPSGSEGGKYVLSTPTPRRKSPRSGFVSPAKDTPGMNSVSTDIPKTPRRRKSCPEVPPRTPREGSVRRTDVITQLPLPENECLKPRRNSKQHTPGKPVPEEVLKEICARANSKEGHTETPAAFPSSKSPRRNSRQRKESSDKIVHSETLATEGMVPAPVGHTPGSARKTGKSRTSGVLRQTALQTSAVQEHPDKTPARQESGSRAELSTEGSQQTPGLEDGSGVRPRRLSAKRRSSGSAPVLEGDESVSDTNTPGLMAAEQSGKARRSTQKRKSAELLLQSSSKRKRVSFGGQLSPELFDKSLPPNSPLKRGALPARQSLPYGDSPRAVLKKAQGLKSLAEQEKKRSPKSSPAQKSPSASSPASGKATPFALGSPAPYRKGRFSISYPPTALPMAEEKDPGTADMNPKEKTPQSSSANQDEKTFGRATPARSTRGAQVRLKSTPEEERKIKGHFSTGHAGSPATIVVGRSYSTTVRSAGRVPKVVRNPTLKLNMNMDESFTGVSEMFQTPENTSEKTLPLAAAGNAEWTPTCAAGDTSELNTPEESGEMLVSPLNNSDASEQKQESPGIHYLLRQALSPSSVFDEIATKTPARRKAVQKDNISVSRLSVVPAKQASLVKTGRKRRTPKQNSEPVEAMSGMKRLLRTPEQKSEPVEALSGIKQLMKTPKQKTEPVEALSGVKRLMRTPRQKPEPLEDLSGIKELMRTPETPKVKYQPVEDMVGISRIFKTPEDKVEPVENMFGISRLMKTPRQKYQPVEDFVGLQRLMAEPRQKSAVEVDYGGVTELFGTPEEVKVRAVSVMDSQQDAPTPCSNSTHENQGQTAQGEDSQQKESTGEDQPTQTSRRGRPRKTVPPASAKQCAQRGNLKESQSLDAASTQEEMRTITSESKGRGRRTRRCVQEEIISKQPEQERLEIGSVVEPHGATQRPARGGRKQLKELKHPSENLESCVEDSGLQEESTSMNQAVQEQCGLNDIIETEAGPSTRRVSDNLPNQNCQLQTGKKPESKPDGSGREECEEVLLSPWRRTRGAENTEPLIPAKRGRRARNDQAKQVPSADLDGTRRKLRRDPSAKIIQSDEQTFDKGPETVTAEESESETKPEIKVTEKSVRSLRSTGNRKLSAEVKVADICEVALENTQSTQETEETSTETQSHSKNGIKASQGYGTENAKEVRRERAPSAEANQAALNLEATRGAVQETTRTRSRRGKKDSLENKADEFTEDVNKIKLITPKSKSETEMDEPSLKDPLGSVCGKDTSQGTKDGKSPGVTSAKSDSPAHSPRRRTRNEVQPKPTALLQENPAQRSGTVCRRGRGKKVSFDLENSSKVDEGKSLPGEEEGTADTGSQHENPQTAPSRGRRGRRKQVDSIPQIASPTLRETQDQITAEAVVKEQVSGEEANPSAGDNPPRRGRRQEVSAAPQTLRSPSVRTRRRLLEDDEKKAVREVESPTLGHQAVQAKANASARVKKRKIDVAAEAQSSAPLQGKRGSSDTGDEGRNEQQNVPLETVSCEKEKPLGRGRRREAAVVSPTAYSISLQGKHGLPAGNGGEGAPEASKEEQNLSLETCDSSGKENQLRRGRRKGTALLLEATDSTSLQGKRSGRKNNAREAKKLILEKSPSQENRDLPKRNSRQTGTSLAVSSPSLQGLLEDGRKETPEDPQEGALSAREKPSRVGRKKATSSPSEETNPTSLREKPGLPKGRGQRGIPKGEDTSPSNNSCQRRMRQLRNNSRKVEFTSGAATPVSPHKNLAANGSSSESQSGCLAPTGAEGSDQSGKGQQVNPRPQRTSTSRKRRGQLPAEDLGPKKLKS